MTPGQRWWGLGPVARMEWIKLRTLRSTWWTLAITVVAAIGISVAVGTNTKDGSGDLTNNALGGVAVGLLLSGILGVLVITSEYSCGMIRTTLTATPNRLVLLAGKAAVFAATSFVVGEIASFLSFLAGTAALPASITGPSLGDPGVLRAVLMSGAGYCLIGLIGLGLGTIIRYSPAAIAVLVGGVYVAAQVVGAVANSVIGYVPVSIVANSISTVQRLPHTPSPWAGLAVLVLYAAVALAIGGALLARRDA
jgi:ABC-2 type transport system permease protein